MSTPNFIRLTEPIACHPDAEILPGTIGKVVEEKALCFGINFPRGFRYVKKTECEPYTPPQVGDKVALNKPIAKTAFEQLPIGTVGMVVAYEPYKSVVTFPQHGIESVAIAWGDLDIIHRPTNPELITGELIPGILDETLQLPHLTKLELFTLVAMHRLADKLADPRQIGKAAIRLAKETLEALEKEQND